MSRELYMFNPSVFFVADAQKDPDNFYDLVMSYLKEELGHNWGLYEPKVISDLNDIPNSVLGSKNFDLKTYGLYGAKDKEPNTIISWLDQYNKTIVIKGKKFKLVPIEE